MRSALILIDFQQGFDHPRWGQRNHPEAESRALMLLAHARQQGWQVVIVRHDSPEPDSPLRPGQPGHALKPGFEPQPGDWLVSKCVHSAFIGTSLAQDLRAAGCLQLVIAGITTDQCVSTTTRMAQNLGFEAILVEDACACFGLTGVDGWPVSAQALHAAHVATIHAEFARVTTVAALLAQPSPAMPPHVPAVDLRSLLPEPSDLVRRKVLPALDAAMRAFIALSPFVIVGSHGADGQADVSPRGDPPGFVAVLDAHTLLIPERPGNRRADTLRNVLQTGEVGLLFLIPGVMDTLRVNGRARLVTDAARLAPLAVQGKAPAIALEVSLREAYLHCARCTHRSGLWDAARWPAEGALPHLADMLAAQIEGLDAHALRASLDEMYRTGLY